jgi:hypothetical protein
VNDPGMNVGELVFGYEHRVGPFICIQKATSQVEAEEGEDEQGGPPDPECLKYDHGEGRERRNHDHGTGHQQWDLR